MEQLEVINTSTPPGTRVLVVWDGWRICVGTLLSLNSDGKYATVSGSDGTEDEFWAYSVHVCPEAKP